MPKTRLRDEMHAITQLTRRGKLGEATAAIRRLLSGGKPPATDVPARPAAHALLPDLLQALRRRAHAPAPHLPPAEPSPEPKPADTAPRRAEFLARSFTNEAGTRPYKLYVPAGYQGEPVPLVVMLHGCTQSPDDFAVGTKMNLAAEEMTCLVAYPGQTASANSQKCWNWFNPADQQRDSGEPSLVAGIVHEVMRDYRVDPRRIYAAGLSAGGAAADVLATRYPDLFAAIGVHSGLACGAAHDLTSAFAAMQSGPSGVPPQRPHRVPTIVFHGDRDNVVNPRNGQAVVAEAVAGAQLRAESAEGHVPGGHTYTRICHLDMHGKSQVEQWIVHGGGHAWCGGDPAGSFTDPKGPDATGEMLRFFMTHERQ